MYTVYKKITISLYRYVYVIFIYEVLFPKEK